MSSSPRLLSLRDIASWQFPELACNQATEGTRLVAALPSLQRGAVWKPGQVEMLWDSILRGFPVGSFVVCPKFQGQASHSGRHGRGWPEEAVTHFLLDGQQRANAIALAFRDALIPEPDGEDPAATLWIDLAPGFPPSSTRHFSVRMLTIAHPWGFGPGDDARFLGVSAIRDALKRHEGSRRPRLIDSWPYESNRPVPLQWLLEAAVLAEGEGSLWSQVLCRCQTAEADRRTWLPEVIALISRHLEASEPSPVLNEIEAAVRALGRYRLVALEVPREVLSDEGSSELDSDEGGASRERIHQVEHLFHRLNSAGTVLRGEELLFSMIKAYWPDIENSFAELSDREGHTFLPMPGSRLATLGIRAALSQLEEPPAFRGDLSIPQIRAMAVERDAKSASRSRAIRQYLGIEASIPPKESDLHLNLRRVDGWLLNRKEIPGDPGLPPALRSHLAQGAPDVYLLLLHLAQETRKRRLGDEAVEALRKPMLALATCLHWFGCRTDATVRRLIPLLHASPMREESFRGILANPLDAGMPSEVLRLIDPAKLGATLPPVNPVDDLLPNWTPWHGIVACFAEGTPERQERESVVWPLWERLLSSKPLLLFGQRDYVARRFDGFDPSCVDICNGHDRPWDYDHLLPTNVLYRNQGLYRDACRQWGNSIGNLRAWPLEENRSRHDELPETSIPDEALADSLLHGPEERQAFSLRWEDLGNREKCAAFMNAARSRSLRLYRDWFETLEIANLFTEPN